MPFLTFPVSGATPTSMLLRQRFGWSLALSCALALGGLACGAEASSPTTLGGGPATAPDAGPDAQVPGRGSDAGAPAPTPSPGGCIGLQCRRVACDGGATTTVRGTVLDPSGRVPLYNAIVYVPNAPVAPLTSGVTCDQCGASVKGAVSSALTDANGAFVLENMPTGADIPLVVQVGKWRRQITLAQVPACEVTDVPSELTRLPRNQQEGELPQIAITTGGADTLECFLRKIGISDSEFTRADGTGRVHLYQGLGNKIPFTNITTGNGSALAGGSPPAPSLWNDRSALMRYDVVVLSCEGAEFLGNKPVAARENMDAYLAAGGRVFSSHYHYVWFKEGSQSLRATATWASVNNSTSGPFSVDTSFPKGEAFADWLVNVGASSTRTEIALGDVRNHVSEVNPQTSRRWIYKSTPQGDSAKYYSFNTPVGVPVDAQCGRAVYTDIHISGEDGQGGTFPNNCRTTDLSAQEKALLFLFFDLSACVQNEDEPPVPPTIL